MITTVNLNQKDYEKLKKKLEEEGRTFRWWLNKKIKEELEKDGKKICESTNL